MRIAIRELIESVGLKCQTFGTAHEFLEATLPDGPTCLVLDVRLPKQIAAELDISEKGGIGSHDRKIAAQGCRCVIPLEIGALAASDPYRLRSERGRPYDEGPKCVDITIKGE